MEEIYLDNAATTKPSPTVIKKMMGCLEKDYGNPSSLHRKGIDAENKVKEALSILSNILRVDSKEIYFTSGGTESNNLALLGVAHGYHRSGKHIITTKIEHPSVLNPLGALEEQGFEITYLSVDNTGKIDLEELNAAIREDTILVSIMHVNNETGTIQPIDQIGPLIKNLNHNVLFHVDGIQSFGKFLINPVKSKIDIFSFSAHKFHGPKGVGALYVKQNVKIKPLLYGGYQQRGLRSGTENVPGIVGLGQAAKEAYENRETTVNYLYDLKKKLAKDLLDSIEEVYINGPDVQQGAPHILNVTFEGIQGEVLLHALEAEKIYVSTGSACSSNKPDTSTTLKAMSISNDQINSSIRFSLSVYNVPEEIDHCVIVLKRLVPMLRRFRKGGRKS